jgi:uncharacterized protein (TIGR03435 family)
MRTTIPVAVILLLASVAAQGPSFDAASIKPNVAGPGPVRDAVWPAGGRMTATGLTVREIIKSAYVGDGIQLITQIVGGPSWIDAARFDINAKEASVPAGNADEISRQRSAMLKALLADRFKLKVHAGTQLLPLFDLVLSSKDGKLGPQLKVSTCDRLARSSGLATSDGPPPCVWSRLVKMDPAIGITLGYEGMTMPALAAMLANSPETDRPIRDRTGLAGAFDLQLTQPMPSPPGQAAPDAAASLGNSSGIFTALTEQLGLKLEGRRDQVDVIVIDSVERPSLN